MVKMYWAGIPISVSVPAEVPGRPVTIASLADGEIGGQQRRTNSDRPRRRTCRRHLAQRPGWSAP